MFVYSFKASTLKFAGIAAVSLALLIMLIAIIPTGRLGIGRFG